MTLKSQGHITASAFQIIPEHLTPSDLTADLSLQLKCFIFAPSRNGTNSQEGKPDAVRWMGLSDLQVELSHFQDQLLSEAPHDHCLVSLQEASLDSFGLTSTCTALRMYTSY